MEYTLNREALLRAVRICIPMTKSNSSIPILNYVRLRTSMGSVTLTAYDMETEITASVGAGLGDRSSIVLPAKRLLCFLESIPEGSTVSIGECFDEVPYATLSAGPISAKLGTQPVEDFPELKYHGGSLPAVQIPTATFAQAIELCRPQISQEETRYYLNGAYLHQHEGVLHLVSTDGHRMSIVEMPYVEGARALLHGVIIPRRAVKALAGALVETQAESIIAEIGQCFARFTIGGNIYSIKCIDGVFPDYPRIIPKVPDDAAWFTVGVDDLRRATDAICRFDKQTYPLRLTIDGGSFAAWVKVLDETFTFRMPITNPGGASATVAFNPRYMRDMLASIEGNLTFYLRSGIETINEPVVFSTSEPAPYAGAGELTWTGILMPMRV